MVKPISVDKTLSESWAFRLKGAPPELLQRTTMYNRLINSPFSVVGHDDLQAYCGIQAGLHASGNEWVSLHRNFDPAETGGGEITTVGTRCRSTSCASAAQAQSLGTGVASLAGPPKG